ncbi:MAG: DNA ligase (ATP) [Cirrosporium novae-zelandiae]|nr:MAG: DNA ligase (ATP) [Cirrosporium novae-zelandiae]
MASHRDGDVEMMDVEGDTPQPQAVDLEKELDERYPNRPHNHSPTLPFHDLFLTLFNPLNENKKKPTGPVAARRRVGPNAASNSPQEVRRHIIERFVSRWRKEVGDDIFPALRLIIPDKDRDRAMYGLKEKAIGKLLVKVMKIDKNSEDGFNLLNWKLPGQSTASRMAGDFAGRCYEVIVKRPLRTTAGDMTIEEVNDRLDKLSAVQREQQQAPIFDELYHRMNAEEMMWLIRIILRQMKVGATEKTFFHIWHPDAENLFNVSSSLRRICWELHDPTVRLEGEEKGITLMQCYQPQLAQFQMHSFQKMVDRMKPTEDDDAFWIEEKLDGERMQLHMMEDKNTPGGKKFGFWSRKAKDYTYLYGNGFHDGALTRHIKEAFHEGVQSIILDGEMITWDPEQDAMVPFGTLKTAALSLQANPFSEGQRPLYRVFDILYLNGKDITKYTLRDRRRALEASVHSIHRRLELHEYQEAHSATEIEPLLRKVVAEASEGLVLKNPRSLYRLNERHDDWMKVKPEYMTEFGESLDCVVIGGYYGSGTRGGNLSSFMCGLRVDENQIQQGADPMKCYSFFKVGGGFAAADYQQIRHHTDGKWKDWDAKHPPTQYIELSGGELQYERPDVWIKPCDSVVLSVKAASVNTTDQFRMGMTVRFPRFKRLRTDKDWKSALTIQEFLELKKNVEREHQDKEFKVDDGRKRAGMRKKKKPLTVMGDEGASEIKTPFAGPETRLFSGLDFYVITESLSPNKSTKPQIESLNKVHGGSIYQTHNAVPKTICLAARRTVKVASLQKAGTHTLINPSWIFDCVRQAENDRAKGREALILAYEPKHIFSMANKKDSSDDENEEELAAENVDAFGDSYVRDLDISELKLLLEDMRLPKPEKHGDGDTFNKSLFLQQLDDHGHGFRELKGWIFRGCSVYFDDGGSEPSDGGEGEGGVETKILERTVRFGGGTILHYSHENATHIVVAPSTSQERIRGIREEIKW